MPDPTSKVAVLFSGGTDSTASSALLAETYREVHLLTYKRLGFHGAGNSTNNYHKLAKRFPDTKYVHHIFETTELVRRLTEHRRWHYIRKYGFFTLQNCGFCALINHVATMAYCLRHQI